MRLELAERLRCPAAHAPTPLIVVAERTDDRDLVAAMLGCPQCRLEARIVDGDVRFGAVTDAPTDAPTDARSEAPRTSATAPDGSSRGGPSLDLDRVRALLGVSEPGGALLLTGRYAALAGPLAAAGDLSVVVMHGGEESARAERPTVAAVHGCPGAVPFTDGTFRGVALDAGLPSGFVSDAVRATSIGGRVLAVTSVQPPPGIKELARDDTEWVAARESGGAIVELKRRL